MSSDSASLLPSDIAISVRGVSKKFRLFDSPTARLAEALHPFRKQFHREFWALRDISFDVRRGEIVGILGRNGSGKSTLLQVICAVMQATEGEVRTNGRISALLELGAGFNPEFTGRENVFLNGAIMGFSQKEMQARMPEIEAFADIGQFFDQPVKTYSSGMFVRVAFASAIHIDPEILIIDEALAVGDSRFQHKCYGKLERFREAGKSIILVTHDVTQITNRCDRALLIDGGSLQMDGSPRDVVDKYIELLFGDTRPAPADEPINELTSGDAVGAPQQPALFPNRFRLENRAAYCKDEYRFGDRSAEIVDCAVEMDGVVDPPSLSSGRTLTLHLKVEFRQRLQPLFGFTLKNVSGVELYGSNTFMQGISIPAPAAGETRIVSFSFAAPLQPGDYFLDVGVASCDGTKGGIPLDVRRSALMIRIASQSREPTFNGLFDLMPRFQMTDTRGLEVLNWNTRRAM